MRIFFGVVFPCVTLAFALYYLVTGDIASATFLYLVALGNAILWNMEVRK